MSRRALDAFVSTLRRFGTMTDDQRKTLAELGGSLGPIESMTRLVQTESFDDLPADQQYVLLAVAANCDEDGEWEATEEEITEAVARIEYLVQMFAAVAASIGKGPVDASSN